MEGETSYFLEGQTSFIYMTERGLSTLAVFSTATPEAELMRTKLPWRAPEPENRNK